MVTLLTILEVWMRLLWSATLTVFAAGALSAQPPRNQVPAREQASELEAKLAANPNDEMARMRLISLYSTQSGPNSPIPIAEAKEGRRRHIQWLVENKPESSTLASGIAWIDAARTSMADPEGRKMVIAAWLKVVTRDDLNGDALANAGHWLKTDDPAAAISAIEKASAQSNISKINRGNIGRSAAAIMLGGTSTMMGLSVNAADPARANAEPAKRARQLLAKTQDPEVLATAIQTLNSGSGMLRATKMIEFDSSQAAEGLASEWARRSPDDPKPLWVWAELYHSRAMVSARDEKRRNWDRAYEKAELARALQKGPVDTNSNLHHIEAAFESGHHDKVVAYGEAMLADWEKPTGSRFVFNLGEVIHNVNCWLGRVAIEKNDKPTALRHLAAAAKSTGSPVLNSFGPDFTLARELASAGERDAVLSYLEGVGKFWKNDRGNIEKWTAALREGSVPSFNKLAATNENRQKLVGKQAPAIREVSTAGGGKWNLANMRGKIVLVDFWATWCAPCRMQMPALSEFYRTHHDAGFEMIWLSSGEDPEVVKSFLGKNPVSYPVAVAPEETVSDYDAHTLPSAFWILKDGTVAAVDVGAGPGTEKKLETRWLQMLEGRISTPTPEQKPTQQIAAASSTAGNPTPVLRVGNGVSAPQIVYRAEPEYSEEARRARLNASVLLDLVVDEKGAPRDLSIKRGAGFGLDEEALAAVRKWRFKPGFKDGEPVAVASSIEVTFRLLKVDGYARLQFDSPSGAMRPILKTGQVPSPPEGKTGKWSVTFEVNDQGGVSNVEPSEPGQWADHVRYQLERWRFSPAVLSGSPLRVKGKLELSR